MALFHPPTDMLVDYAAGSLAEPLALMVATHVALCAECRAETRALEAVGGAMLEAIDPIPLKAGAFDALLARLDEPAAGAVPHRQPANDDFLRQIPEPLRARVAGADWRRVNANIDEIVLPMAETGVTAQLLRIRAGQTVPRHSHHGHEYTLVLAGGFTDNDHHFGPGDLAIADSAMTHHPVADSDQDCICLAIVDGGLRLAGPIGRVVGLFWRF